jgi:hypothetical protein
MVRMAGIWIEIRLSQAQAPAAPDLSTVNYCGKVRKPRI